MSRVDEIRKITAEGETRAAKERQEAHQEERRKKEETKARAKIHAHELFLENLPKIEERAAKGEHQYSITVNSMSSSVSDYMYYTGVYLVEELKLPENGFSAKSIWTESNSDPDYGEIHSGYVEVTW